MIQANVLRIGNLVEKSIKSGQGRTLICKIGCEDIVRVFENIGSFNYNPIPLTEEWLLKAGFELYDYEPNEEGDEFPDFIYMSYKITPPEKLYYYTITNTPEDGGYFDFCIKVQFADYVMLSTLQYVHQLQNLYFALTGKELEFKL